MNWPFEMMCVCFVLLVLATVGGLVSTIARQYFWASLAVAVLAALVFERYEHLVHSAARPSDPLIRVDLLVLNPLLGLVWIFQVSAAVRYLLALLSVRQPSAR